MEANFPICFLSCTVVSVFAELCSCVATTETRVVNSDRFQIVLFTFVSTYQDKFCEFKRRLWEALETCRNCDNSDDCFPKGNELIFRAEEAESNRFVK